MSNNLYPITYWYGIRKEFLSRERLEEACAFWLCARSWDCVPMSRIPA